MPGFNRHTPTLNGTKIVRALSIDSALIPHVSDAITQLVNDWMWLEVGDTVEDVVKECSSAVESWYIPMEIGMTSYFLGSLPGGWLPLDGTTYDELDYPELFAQLDAQFKDEINDTFTLPDLDTLFVRNTTSNGEIGSLGGASTVTLTSAQMPAHTHNYESVIIDIDIKTVGTPDPGGARVGPLLPTSSTGSGEAHENEPPYVSMVMGIFSGRIY